MVISASPLPAIPNLRFVLAVGRYLMAGPSIDEKACLKQFFVSLRSGTNADVPSLLVRELFNFHVCNHIVTLRVTGLGAATVIDIRRNMMQTGTR